MHFAGATGKDQALPQIKTKPYPR